MFDWMDTRAVLGSLFLNDELEGSDLSMRLSLIPYHGQDLFG